MINSFKTLIPPTGFVADEQFNKSLEFCGLVYTLIVSLD